VPKRPVGTPPTRGPTGADLDQEGKYTRKKAVLAEKREPRCRTAVLPPTGSWRYQTRRPNPT